MIRLRLPGMFTPLGPPKRRYLIPPYEASYPKNTDSLLEL